MMAPLFRGLTALFQRTFARRGASGSRLRSGERMRLPIAALAGAKAPVLMRDCAGRMER